MGDPLSEEQEEEERRVACPLCGEPILEGAHKCRACRRWLVEPARPRRQKLSRSLTLTVAGVAAVVAVLVSQRPSPVGEAPPLTPLTTGSAAPAEPDPAQLGPAPRGRPVQAPAPSNEAPAAWRTRTIHVEVHPLDVVFHPEGQAVLVSADDAKIRQYELADGTLSHLASVPAQGDELRLLHDRWVAVVRHQDAGHIPLLDLQHWDRDPVLLRVGEDPADIIALPDGKTAVAASSTGRQLGWFDLTTGGRLADIRLPHVVGQLFLVRAGSRPYVGAMGRLLRAERPAGAWLDLFDPSETPFGATRRSIPVGRDPRAGAVTSDGSSIFFADRPSNQASLLRFDERTDVKTVDVGAGPEAAFLLGHDRYGVTIDSEARTATVVDLRTMNRLTTLMLQGVPRSGATAADGSVLFVSLGGTAWPPTESGAVVIAGDPPRVIAHVETQRGAARVAASRDGHAAVVANYWGKSLTVIER